METKIFTIEELKQIIAPVAKAFGAKKVVLYGSYGRGEATEKSNINLYIERGEIKGLFALAEFENELEKKLLRKVDVVTKESLGKKIIEAIKGEEAVLYEQAQ